MKKLKRLLFFLIFQSIVHAALSQQNVVSYPVPFSQYYNNFVLINPAALGYNSQVSADLGYKRLLGNFSKVSTYYAYAGFRLSELSRAKNRPYSALGVYILNDREGKYLNRTRAYAIYAWHGILSRKVRFSGGFRLGGMNYNVKGTPLSGDGSDTSPDGSVGMWIYSSRHSYGAAYHQLFKSSIQPLEEIAYLSSYFNLMGKSVLVKTTGFRFELAGNVFLPVSDKNEYCTWDITGIGTIKNKLVIAAGIHNKNRLVNSIEIVDLFNSQYLLDICFTYCYTLQSSLINNNFFELGVVYTLAPK